MSEPKERRYERKPMRLEDVSYSDPTSIYFATLCARERGDVFNDHALAQRVVDSLLWRRDHEFIKIYAYCLMPDHLHIAVSPADDSISLSDQLGMFKSFTTSRAWDLSYTGQLWQRSWYDHIARSDENVLAICEYILANPVRKGLVESVEQWPYSGLLDPLPL